MLCEHRAVPLRWRHALLQAATSKQQLSGCFTRPDALPSTLCAAQAARGTRLAADRKRRGVCGRGTPCAAGSCAPSPRALRAPLPDSQSIRACQTRPRGACRLLSALAAAGELLM